MAEGAMITSRVVTNLIIEESQSRHPLHYLKESQLGLSLWIPRSFLSTTFLPNPLTDPLSRLAAYGMGEDHGLPWEGEIDKIS